MKYNTVKIENKGGKENYYTITDKKRYLLSEWVDFCFNFQEGFGIVRKNGKENYIKPDGTFLLSDWVDQIWPFYKSFGCVRIGDTRYTVDKNGNLFLF